jgi:hypothetical protein
VRLEFYFSNRFYFFKQQSRKQKIRKRSRTKKRNQPNWAGPEPTAQQTSPGRKPPQPLSFSL